MNTDVLAEYNIEFLKNGPKSTQLSYSTICCFLTYLDNTDIIDEVVKELDLVIAGQLELLEEQEWIDGYHSIYTFVVAYLEGVVRITRDDGPSEDFPVEDLKNIILAWREYLIT